MPDMNRSGILSFLRRLSKPNPPVRLCILWSSIAVVILCTYPLILRSAGSNEPWVNLIIAGVASNTAITAAIIAHQYRLEPQCRALVANARSMTVQRTREPHFITPWFKKVDAMVCELKEKWSKDARSLQFDVEFKATESEAKRVAKELHDEILPSLSRLARAVAGAQGHSSGELIAEVQETIAAFRDLLGELHPVDLEELGLVASINNLCTRYARFTGRLICFSEQVEECPLGEFQQLCVYRALQAALRMFAASDNDILVVSCHRIGKNNVFIMRCVDRRVSSDGWLSPEKREFGSFESWCTMAGAHTEIGTINYAGFPCDLIMTIPMLETESSGERETNA
ncbi:MAG: hypothetical protein K2W95_18655 [Candidatus Obscuribacterales bacterium]|nr:hypothetical protein [Candidatus Obscuribacterales bacterium]